MNVFFASLLLVSLTMIQGSLAFRSEQVKFMLQEQYTQGYNDGFKNATSCTSCPSVVFNPYTVSATATFGCQSYQDGQYKGNVQISSPYTRDAAATACGAQVSGCSAQGCSASYIKSDATYNCYLKSTSKGTVTIWWGFQEGDAEWACNSWISDCGNNGGCTLQPTN